MCRPNRRSGDDLSTSRQTRGAICGKPSFFTKRKSSPFWTVPLIPVRALQRVQGTNGIEPTRKLSSILHFATEGPAHVTAKPFKGDAAMRTQGNGVGAWKALADCSDGCTKETSRALREKFFNTGLKSGEDPIDYFPKQDDLRARLVDRGERTARRMARWCLLFSNNSTT